MEGILDIGAAVDSDESVTKIEFRSHQPYASTTLNNSDEIRIPVNQQDLYTLPSKSYLYVEGTLFNQHGAVAKKYTLCRNAITHLFQEIRYELNGILVDSVRNPGIATTLKGYASFECNQVMGMSGWVEAKHYATHPLVSKETGYFNACVPLSYLLGFAEDYKKIIINAKQELVLIRSRSDLNAITALTDLEGGEDEVIKVSLTKIAWKIPYVSVSDVEKVQLITYLERGLNVTIPFRTWDLYTYPQLPQSVGKHSWTIKTTTVTERPRYVIVAFQTVRNDVAKQDMSRFDHCNLTNMKLYLNNQVYPYDDLGLNFTQKRIGILYDMYARFQNSYYGKEIIKPFMQDYEVFTIVAPIVIIDCSLQHEPVKSLAPVDVRLEFETSEAIPAKTSVYCVIISEQIFQYNPFTSSVNKIA